MNQRQRRGVSLATLLATIGGVGLLLMTMVLGAGASPGTTISSSSNSTTIGGSTTTTITANLVAADVGDLFGFDVTIHFNPSIATAAVNPGVDLGAGWSNQGVPGTGVDNGTGVLRFVATRFVGCGAACPLFAIHWTGIAAGSFNITLTEAVGFPSLGDLDGVAISYQYNLGTLTVSGPPTNTPTNTPVTPPTATNTSVPGTATNTPTQTSTPIPGTPTSTPTQTLTPTATSTGTVVPTATTASGTATTQPTMAATSTPSGSQTPIPGGPRIYKVYAVMVADDGIPGSGQLVRALGAELLGRFLGPILGPR